jgi:hypothetical protein
MRFRKRLGRCALVATALVLAACNSLTVDQSGVHTSSATTTITGSFEVSQGDSLTSVLVNGTPATISGDQWSAQIPLNGETIWNSVMVEAHFGKGEVIRERRTVVYGDGTHATVVPQGTSLDNGVGLRINESSFTKLGPVIKSLTTIDTAAIAPPGTVLLDECITRVIGCVVYATATTASAPTIDDFDVALDAFAGNTRAVVTLHDLFLTVGINARVFGIPTPCTMEVTADTITIDGRYTLRPDPADPGFLDVNLVGASPVVTTTGVDHDFTGGVCSIPVIEQIVSSVLPDVQTLMQSNLTRVLGDPDGAGTADSPVAEAIEDALANVHIAGPIGDSLGLDLQSNLQTVTNDANGLGFQATASFTADSVAPGAPDLTHTVGWGDTLGPIGTTTPGGQGFDVAVGASASAFNQLLAGETEKGLLNVDVNEIDGQPLTLKSLLDLIGAGGLVTDDRPLVVELRPELAPAVTTNPGPGGALGEMRMAGYRATVKTADPANPVTLIELVIDFRTGVGMVFDGTGLAFTFDQPAEEDFSATITANPFSLPEAVVTDVFRALSPRVFGAVQDALPSFPLPQFVGLNLSPVQIARQGTGFVLYANLTPAT